MTRSLTTLFVRLGAACLLCSLVAAVIGANAWAAPAGGNAAGVPGGANSTSNDQAGGLVDVPDAQVGQIVPSGNRGGNIAAAPGVIPGTAADAEALSCKDFATQADAQTAFDRDRKDPNNLDADHDGVPCGHLIKKADPKATAKGNSKAPAKGGVLAATGLNDKVRLNLAGLFMGLGTLLLAGALSSRRSATG